MMTIMSSFYVSFIFFIIELIDGVVRVSKVITHKFIIPSFIEIKINRLALQTNTNLAESIELIRDSP